jgi:hypothetical protein
LEFWLRLGMELSNSKDRDSFLAQYLVESDIVVSFLYAISETKFLMEGSFFSFYFLLARYK